MRYDDFKIYLDNDKKELAFHVYVASKKYYRVIVDLNSLYEEMFLDIINGSYKFNYFLSLDNIENDFTNKQQFKIDNEDLFKNLKKFSDSENIHRYIVDYKEFAIQDYFTMTFEGKDYGMKQGMSLDAIGNSTSLSKTMFIAANNRNNEYAFQYAKAGSLELGIATAQYDVFSKSILEKLFIDIHNKQINIDLVNVEDGSRKLYQNLLKKLSKELKKFKNLSKIDIVINNNTCTFDNFEYIYDKADEIYGEDIFYERAIIDSLGTFKDYPDEFILKIDISSGGRIHCHFYKEDMSDRDINKLSASRGKEINIYGVKESPRTVTLDRFEFPSPLNKNVD